MKPTRLTWQNDCFLFYFKVLSLVEEENLFLVIALKVFFSFLYFSIVLHVISDNVKREGSPCLLNFLYLEGWEGLGWQTSELRNHWPAVSKRKAIWQFPTPTNVAKSADAVHRWISLPAWSYSPLEAESIILYTVS